MHWGQLVGAANSFGGGNRWGGGWGGGQGWGGNNQWGLGQWGGGQGWGGGWGNRWGGGQGWGGNNQWGLGQWGGNQWGGVQWGGNQGLGNQFWGFGNNIMGGGQFGRNDRVNGIFNSLFNVNNQLGTANNLISLSGITQDHLVGTVGNATRLVHHTAGLGSRLMSAVGFHPQHDMPPPPHFHAYGQPQYNHQQNYHYPPQYPRYRQDTPNEYNYPPEALANSTPPDYSQPRIPRAEIVPENEPIATLPAGNERAQMQAVQAGLEILGYQTQGGAHQATIDAMGNNINRSMLDGIDGELTSRALKAVQKKYKLAQTGDINEDTIRALNTEISAPNVPNRNLPSQSRQK